MNVCKEKVPPGFPICFSPCRSTSLMFLPFLFLPNAHPPVVHIVYIHPDIRRSAFFTILLQIKVTVQFVFSGKICWICAVYFVHFPMFSVLSHVYTCLPELFSYFSMLLFADAVHSQKLLFLSLQVNGSDGMYKYEEIILERVSFKSLYLAVPPPPLHF